MGEVPNLNEFHDSRLHARQGDLGDCNESRCRDSHGQDKTPGRWTKRAIARMHESDTLMTHVLAGGCLKRGRRFVYTSGALNYMGQGDAWFDESAPVRPCLLARGHATLVA